MMFAGVLLMLFTILLIQITDCYPPDFFEAVSNCTSEFGLDLDTFWKGDASEDKKCVYRCVMQGVHLVDADGQFTTQDFRESHSEGVNTFTEEMLKKVEDCVALSKDSDVCDNVRTFHKCYAT